MQITSLYVKNYKILKDFRVAFNQPLSVLIGKNGSGKSTILEALALILRGAYLHFEENRKDLIRPFVPFDFELNYTLKQGEKEPLKVTLKGQNGDTDFWSMSIQENNTTTFLYPNQAINYLPNNVVIYYAGWFKTMQQICQVHQNLYKKGLKEESKDSYKGFKALAAQKMFYVQGSHFDMLLASLFSFEFSDEIKKFFEEKIGVASSPLSISISLKNLKPPTLNRGILSYFIEQLHQFGTETLGKTEFSKTYAFTSKQWYDFKNQYSVKENQIFYLLNMLHAAGLLRQINIKMNKKDSTEIIISTHLSEGEQQLITIKAISELLIEDNTLLLFDEPDTYSHPSWQRAFLKNVEETIIEQDAHLIVSSHSPMMIANMKKGDLYKMNNGNAQLVGNGYYGKDYGFTLATYMETETRNEDAKKDLDVLFDLIETDKFKEATKLLEILNEKYPNEPELTRAQTLITLLTDED